MKTRSLFTVLLMILPYFVAIAQESCIVSTSQIVNLRGGPGTNFEIVDQLASTDHLDVVSQTSGSDGFIWYYLSNDAWVRSDVIDISGACSNLPEYDENATETPQAEENPQVLDGSSTYSTSELDALRSNPNTIAFEDFSSNARQWPADDASGDDFRVRIGPSDGVYVTDASYPSERALSLFIRPEGQDFYVDEPFVMSAEIGNVDINRRGSDWRLVFGFNLQQIGQDNINAQYSITGDGIWSFSGFYNGGRVDPLDGELPENINLFDGNIHRISVQVTDTSDGIGATLLIDDQFITYQTSPEESFIDVVDNAYDDIDGEVFLGISLLGADDDISTTDVFLTFDNFVLQRFEPEGIASSTGLGELTQQYNIGRASFRYPKDWVVASNPAITDRAASNADIYNITAFNSPTGFSGAPNEFGFTLYEPAYITETGLLWHTPNLTLEEVLTQFISGEEGSDISTQVSLPEQITLNDGRTAVLTTLVDSTADKMWIAFRSSDESVAIMQTFTASGQLSEFTPKLLEIATTADYPLPPQNLDDHEEILRKYLIMANSGAPGEALSLMCSADRLGYSLFSAILDEAGGFAGAIGFAPIRDLELVVFSANADSRYYETISMEDGIARVRVMGTVRISYPTGEQTIVKHSDFFTGDGFGLFGSDDFRMAMNDSGNWEVCPRQFE